jgi:Uncharacterized conserved protein, contains double-stranded beta-helix domain
MRDSATASSPSLPFFMKTQNRIPFSSLAFAVACACSPVGAQGAPTTVRAVPVYQEARHHLVFENALVRVLDVRVPAKDTTDFHVHANRHIAVVIEGARSWDQKAGAVIPESASDAIPIGTVFDNAQDAIPYTHRVANVDTVAFRYIVAQLLAPSGVASSILPASSGLKLDHEALGARVYRVTLAPGQATPRHPHAAPGITVQVNAGMLRVEGAKPEGSSVESGAGAWWWRGTGTEHVLRNAGAKPVDVVEIDWP